MGHPGRRDGQHDWVLAVKSGLFIYGAVLKAACGGVGSQVSNTVMMHAGGFSSLLFS